jgi:glycerol-3-phosphate dehydrogenase
VRVALIDQGDLASGTSSKSSRLVHGGVRYLEQGHLRLVFEALAERGILLRIAPHLVHPLRFTFPLYQQGRLRRWKLGLGLLAYDLLAGSRNVRPHRGLSKHGVLEREPALRARDLLGGAAYSDAQCDDARLVVATARSAAAHGAAITTYASATAFLSEQGRVCALEVQDHLTGATATIRGTVVINATGPWSDLIRQLEQPGTPPTLDCTKGVHVVVPRARLAHEEAITFLSPVDSRVMFVLPWGDWSYIGTTETVDRTSPDGTSTTAEDVTYLLRSANACFPGAHLTSADVVASWAGLRPLLAQDGQSGGSLNREHRIDVGTLGVLHVAGGKLTTYRRMAAEVVDRAVELVTARGGTAPRTHAATDTEPLPGGDAHDMAPLHSVGRDAGLPRDTVQHLVKHYGTEAAAMFTLVRAEPALAARIHPEHPAIAAEVLFHARRELAERVDDVLVRRIHLFYETHDQGVAAAPAVAELLGRERAWDAERVREESVRYVSMVARESHRRAG